MGGAFWMEEADVERNGWRWVDRAWGGKGTRAVGWVVLVKGWPQHGEKAVFFGERGWTKQGVTFYTA